MSEWFGRYSTLLPRLIIVNGILLCLITVMALFGSLMKSPAQFLPMMIGIPVLFFGVVSLNPHRRYRSSQLMGVIVSVGVLMGGGRLTTLAMRQEWGLVSTLNLSLLIATTLTCLITLALCLAVCRSSRRRGRWSAKRIAKATLTPPGDQDRSVVPAASASPTPRSVDHEATAG